MTRSFRSLLMIPLVALLLAGGLLTDLGVAEAQARFQVQAVGDNGEALTSGRCRVLNAGLQTDATIYTAGDLGTAATNPLTLDTTLGTCSWFGVSGTDTYDVIMWTTSGPYQGKVVRVDAVTRQSIKRVPFSRAIGMLAYVVAIPASANAATVSSGITLPAGTMLAYATLETVTAGTSGAKTLIGFMPTGHGAINSICNGTADAVATVDCQLTPGIMNNSGVLAYSTQGHSNGGYGVIYVLPGALNQP